MGVITRRRWQSKYLREPHFGVALFASVFCGVNKIPNAINANFRPYFTLKHLQFQAKHLSAIETCFASQKITLVWLPPARSHWTEFIIGQASWSTASSDSLLSFFDELILYALDTFVMSMKSFGVAEMWNNSSETAQLKCTLLLECLQRR